MMRIAIEGCTHGELEKTYQTIKQIGERDRKLFVCSELMVFIILII